jgi:hypothetical protein
LFLILDRFSDRRTGAEGSRLAFDQDRAAGGVWVHPLGDAVIKRQNVMARCLDQPQALQVIALVRICFAGLFA